MTDLSHDIATEIMGWKAEISPKTNKIWWVDKDGDLLHEDDWNPPDDLAQAFEVEDRIAELELQHAYAACVEVEIMKTNCGLSAWSLIHTTAEQRCKAALAAKRG